MLVVTGNEAVGATAEGELEELVVLAVSALAYPLRDLDLDAGLNEHAQERAAFGRGNVGIDLRAPEHFCRLGADLVGKEYNTLLERGGTLARGSILEIGAR